MTVTLRQPISTKTGENKIIIPKGTQGMVKAISNSEAIKKAFPNLEHKVDGYFYIVNFPSFIDEILCSREQLNFE